MSNNGFERFEVSYAYDVKLLSKPRKENNYYFRQLNWASMQNPDI